jgi:DNA-binding NarL/FixJ family response regulator
MRVLIVDDDERVRNALSTFFDTGDEFTVVGEAADGAEAIARCRQLHPDVVLMDLKMPVMDGVAATRRIRKEFPHIPVSVLTSSVEWERIEASLRAGASAYLLKSSNTEKLVQVLRATRRGYNAPLRVPQPLIKQPARLMKPNRGVT